MSGIQFPSTRRSTVVNTCPCMHLLHIYFGHPYDFFPHTVKHLRLHFHQSPQQDNISFESLPVMNRFGVTSYAMRVVATVIYAVFIPSFVFKFAISALYITPPEPTSAYHSEARCDDFDRSDGTRTIFCECFGFGD